MSFRSEDPPPPANLVVVQPPASDNPTSAMLKADLDCGRTADKVQHYDVGMVQLGTCDEAAGTPPTPERIALARKAEAANRSARNASDPQGYRSWVKPMYYGLIGGVGSILILAMWLLQ